MCPLHSPVATARLVVSVIEMSSHTSDVYARFVCRYVERFDPKDRLWLPLAPLPTVRFGLACSTLHGYGYLVGGTSMLSIPALSLCMCVSMSLEPSLCALNRFRDAKHAIRC